MVAFLMPWKRTTVEVTATKVISHHLWTLFDMIHIGENEWMVAANKYDDTLHSKTAIFIGLVVSLLLFTITAFAANLFYPREVVPRFANDVVAFLVGTVILILAITFQADFDAYWKYESMQIGAGKTYDWEQDFLVIGVLVGQMVLSLVLLVDKYGDFMRQCRK